MVQGTLLSYLPSPQSSPHPQTQIVTSDTFHLLLWLNLCSQWLSPPETPDLSLPLTVLGVPSRLGLCVSSTWESGRSLSTCLVFPWEIVFGTGLVRVETANSTKETPEKWKGLRKKKKDFPLLLYFHRFSKVYVPSYKYLFICLFMCMHIHQGMYVCHVTAGAWEKPEGTSCLTWVLQTNPTPLQEQWALSTSEPSLQLPCCFYNLLNALNSCTNHSKIYHKNKADCISSF